MELKFRFLRADEIDCRVARISKSGVFLLLYKDARCDMNILDETVGKMNWQRSHSRENANCTVSIWNEEKKIWISKEDTGTESNTEKEKGLASDSFKRACFNWGIGRELYTAPRVLIPAKSCSIKETNGRYVCYDDFSVKKIGYDDNGRISELEIVKKVGNSEITVFCFPERQAKKDDKQKAHDDACAENQVSKTAVISAQKIGKTKAAALSQLFADKKIDEAKVLILYKVEHLEDLTETKHKNIIEHINEIASRYGV